MAQRHAVGEYHIWYCMTHDDGCITSPVEQCHSNFCGVESDLCDTRLMNIIRFDGQNCHVKGQLFKNYSRYSSGFKFEYFARLLYDSNGQLCQPEEMAIHPVCKWILEQSKPSTH